MSAQERPRTGLDSDGVAKVGAVQLPVHAQLALRQHHVVLLHVLAGSHRQARAIQAHCTAKYLISIVCFHCHCSGGASACILSADMARHAPFRPTAQVSLMIGCSHSDQAMPSDQVMLNSDQVMLTVQAGSKAFTHVQVMCR